MSEPIGKLMYIGKSSKGDLINGKTYDCLDLSFGDVQVIDESGEPYWYSATNPAGGGGKDHSVWAVIEDNSNKKLLTEFVSGKNDRTEKDKAEEEGKILASLSIETGKGSRMMKHKKIVRRYVEETPELKETREKQFETIAKILVGSFCDNMCKYGSFENYKKSFDSQPGDEYEYDFDGKKYKIVKNEKSWTVFHITKSKSILVERVSLKQCPKVNDVKIHIATSGKY